jgi:hypothetical protein
MVEDAPAQGSGESDIPQWRGWLERVGEDWWATLLGGVIVALAVADLLPRIPW